MDEINSFIASLCSDNSTLSNVLKPVYILLMRIIKNCYKLIVTDATISQNVFNLLETRINLLDNKTVFLRNEFKKYNGINAIQVNDENEFINMMHEQVKNKDYFLCASDSKDNIDKIYHDIKTDTQEDKILFTSATHLKITDASKQFYKKFIFYSPSIVTGIDFSISDPQNVFIHINAGSISPIGNFQQLTRTRNIKNVYFYIKDSLPKMPTFNNLEDTKTHYKNIVYSHNKLSSLCLKTSEEDPDEYEFNENTFFNIFTYNEYINDIYKTSHKTHFINILKQNKFIINDVGIKQTLNPVKKEQLKILINELTDIEFNDTITGKNENKIIKQRITFLKLTKETAPEFKEILINPHQLNDYLNFSRLLKNEEYVLSKINKEKYKVPEYKAVFSNYYKIKLIFDIEKELNRSRYDIEFIKIDIPFSFTTQLTNKINSTFRSKDQPKTYNEAIKYYINKLSHMTGSIKVIKNVRTQENRKRTHNFIIDHDIFCKFIKLHDITGTRKNMIITPLLDNYKEDIQPEPIEDITFIDTDNDILDVYALPDPTGLDYGI